MIRRIWELGRAHLVELGIVALAVANEVEIAVTHVDLNRPVQLVLGLLFAAPLLARRRFPLGAPALVFATFALDVQIDSVGLHALNVAFLCALTAAFAMGAIGELHRSAAGGAIAVAAILWVQSHLGPNDAGAWAGTLFLFASLWAIGYFLNSRARAAKVAEARAGSAAAEERARLARELHDMVGHSVSVMTVQASAVRRLLRPDQEREREALLAVEEAGREALAEMRRLVGVLRRPEEAPALAPQPSLEHLGKLVEHAREAGLPVDVRVEGEPVQLPAGVDLTAYRLVQEGLTNALKHSGARSAEVVVRYGDGGVELTVSDDGTGAGGGDGGGHGLVGMRERVSVYGGELEAGPRPEGGYQLHARLPAKPA